MELLEGQTLRELISATASKRLSLPLEKLLNLAMQIAEGLHAAHQKGIIHRDIKPANIFVTPQWQAKILDFGVAKWALLETAAETATRTGNTESGATLNPQEAVSVVDRDPFLSRTGVAIGTAGYMSPEQARGEKLDARTDLFSFGLVLYEMATGQRAFKGDTGPILLDAILNRTPTAVRELNPAQPVRLEVLINKALEKDRNLRYQSAADIRTDLQNLKLEADATRSPAGLESAAAGASTKKEKSAAVKDGAAFEGRRRLAIAGLAAVALALAGLAASYFYLHRAAVLTDKDTIVLTDFANTTGDAVFDDTLKQALSIQLEQSPFLSLVSEQRVQQTLRLMGQPADARLISKIARELCQRVEGTAVLEGAIASLGSDYVVGLKAMNCGTGNTLAQEQGTANSKEQVLKVLDGAAVKLRGKLGESLSTVEKYATPIEQATTPSLEALQAYSLGRKNLVGKGDSAAAMPFFQRAIHLDSNFVMAYASLGAIYGNLGEGSLGEENFRKAYDLRERVSERERFFIEAHYFLLGIGDLDKARRAYELWTQTYPRDFAPLNNLAVSYAGLGQYENSLKAARAALRVNPGSGAAYVNLELAYLHLNRLEEAGAVVEEAQSKNLDAPFLHEDLYNLAFLQGDAAGMAKQVAWATGKPGVEDTLLALEADTAAFSGQLGKAREFSSRAITLAKQAGEKETAASYEAAAALREALFGDAAKARQRAVAALALSTGRDVQFGAALALAIAGDPARAQTLTKDLAKRFPENTVAKFNYVPTMRAALALRRKNSANSSSISTSEAIETLQVAAPYELGIPSFADFSPIMFPVYLRGEAYLAAHQGKKAAAEFQKILDHSGVVQNESIGALAHLQLGRAYALQGDTAKARAAYQDFLTLWKDADPAIPILREAKAEFAKLH